MQARRTADRSGFRHLLCQFAGCLLLLAAPALVPAAEPEPVSIVAERVSGHVHPSICHTAEGTLVVVYQGKGHDVLLCSRSTDGGSSWTKPEPISTTAKRPESIREVKKFEVYPGTVDALSDGRVLVTWNYIADDKATDGYYERALLYSLSSDEGRTWTEQGLIGPVDGKHLGAVRHNVLAWPDGKWLLPLRVGPPRLFDPVSGRLEVFPLIGPDQKPHSWQQISRTSEGTLLAMGPVFLRSTDDGETWTAVENFPAKPEGDSAEGRYLTPLDEGHVLVTWGVGTQNLGIRYNISTDDGRTWSQEPVMLLPDTPVTARYYSARTIPLDAEHIGTVYMNRRGVHFLKVPLSRLAP